MNYPLSSFLLGHYTHLFEDSRLLPSEHLERVEDLVREVLIDASTPRQVTALAPVLVYNLERLNLNKLWSQFVDYNLERRLGWLVNSTLDAVRGELLGPLSRKQAAPLLKADVALESFLNRIESKQLQGNTETAWDTLGAPVSNRKTLAEVRNANSDISRRWGILTSIQPQDFSEALKATYDTH